MWDFLCGSWPSHQLSVYVVTIEPGPWGLLPGTINISLKGQTLPHAKLPHSNLWDFYNSLRAERHFSIIFTFFGGAPGTCDSTLNPILYNVMSHRYRVAFKETLCGKRKTYSNGLGRDQSSFRETTVASTAGYENSHLVSTIFHTFDVWCNEIWCLMELNHQVRIRSVRASHYKERNSMNTNTMWKNNNSSTASVKKVS